jgi:hypothetical protein
VYRNRLAQFAKTPRPTLPSSQTYFPNVAALRMTFRVVNAPALK